MILSPIDLAGFVAFGSLFEIQFQALSARDTL